jgi:hypothetical protein
MYAKQRHKLEYNAAVRHVIIHVSPCAHRTWRRYGDSLRSGWRDIMECITRLHKLGLMPATILAVDGEPPEVCVLTQAHILRKLLMCVRHVGEP